MMQSDMRVYLSGLCLGLVFLVSCSSAGNSGSSAPEITAIHGLWIEADACKCDVHPTVESSLAGVPVPCFHYFVSSGDTTRAVSGYIRLKASPDTNRDAVVAAQNCDGGNRASNYNLDHIDELKELFDGIKSTDIAFSWKGETLLPDSIGSVAFAVATMQGGTPQQVTIQRSGHNEDGTTQTGSGLDFLYADSVTRSLASDPGGNGIICSSYWKKNDDELYLGVPGEQHDENCRSVPRYRTVERYVRLGE